MSNRDNLPRYYGYISYDSVLTSYLTNTAKMDERTYRVVHVLISRHLSPRACHHGPSYSGGDCVARHHPRDFNVCALVVRALTARSASYNIYDAPSLGT